MFVYIQNMLSTVCALIYSVFRERERERERVVVVHVCQVAIAFNVLSEKCAECSVTL